MRVKLANLVRLGEVAPERTTVYTWNADENEHMLAINIALGFDAARHVGGVPARLSGCRIVARVRRRRQPRDAACVAAGTSGTGATDRFVNDTRTMGVRSAGTAARCGRTR